MPTGPVYLAFSSPALDATGVEATIQAAAGLEMAQVPNGATMEKIHDALLNAENPLVVVGPDVRTSGGQNELLELVENYALPVAVGFYDYGGFPMQHPNYVGMIDAISDKGYDVVCCIGCCMIGTPDVLDLGDANSFTDLWHGQTFQDFRQAHLDGDIPRACQGCYEAKNE